MWKGTWCIFVGFVGGNSAVDEGGVENDEESTMAIYIRQLMEWSIHLLKVVQDKVK